jgi:hypothetical protein
MRRKGYLLIEIVFALSLFALVAGVVSQGFLFGLKLYKKSKNNNSNEGVITTLLINRIKEPKVGDLIEMTFGQESWRLRIDELTKVARISNSLNALAIKVSKTIDAKGNPVAAPEEKEYHIFRYFP